MLVSLILHWDLHPLLLMKIDHFNPSMEFSSHKALFSSSITRFNNVSFIDSTYWFASSLINENCPFQSFYGLQFSQTLFSSSITPFHYVSFIDSTYWFASSIINENCPFQSFFGVHFSQSSFFFINNSIPLCEFHWFYILICILYH